MSMISKLVSAVILNFVANFPSHFSESLILSIDAGSESAMSIVMFLYLSARLESPNRHSHYQARFEHKLIPCFFLPPS
jgi:hypothetical protein